MHLFQPFAYQAEGFAETRFQRGLELFVHGLTHLFEAVVHRAADRFELRAYGSAQKLGALVILIDEPLHAGSKLFPKRAIIFT
jgi:hypothetical protein